MEPQEKSPILYSRVFGQTGRPLLVLHGVFGLCAHWALWASRMACTGWQVHTLDLRGHGRSFRSAEMTLDAMGDDVARYMDSRNISSAVILGHSMGGKTAMDFACRYPQRCAGLVAVDIAPRAYDPRGFIRLAQTAGRVEREGFTVREAAVSALAKAVNDPGWLAVLAQNLYRGPGGRYVFRFDARAIEENAGSLTAALPREFSFRGKALLLRGGDSVHVSHEDAAAFAEYFPMAETVVVPGAGHWVHAEVPDVFFREVCRFLG